MLHCPHCQRPHPILRDLLTCCPRELRRLMDTLSASNNGSDYRDYLAGLPVPPRFRRVMTPDTPQEAA